MKNILLASALILFTSEAFAVVEECKGVDLKDVVKNLKEVVKEEKHAKAHERFNAELVEDDRKCVHKLVELSKEKKELSGTEEEIVTLHEELESKSKE